MTPVESTPNQRTRRAPDGRPLARLAALLCALLPLAAGGCRSYDDARVLQVLNQRGFGRKYAGDSNEVLTIGIRDSFTVVDREHKEISKEYTVRMDGVVTAELIGEVYVAGFTTDEIAQVLNHRYGEYLLGVDVTVIPQNLRSKRFFMRGETIPGEVQFVGDTTVWDAVMSRNVQPTADLSDIYILRADPQHPLVIPVDLEKMLENGDSGDNVLLREDDIVVVNPNFFGVLQNLVELILSPLQPVVQLVSGLNQIENQYNSLTGDEDGYYGGYYGGGYNSSYNQGFGQVGGQ